MVAATVSWRAGWARPRRAAQRARLCASTQQASQAPLAGNRPEGQPLRVVDAAPAHQHRRHQRQHLATRPRTRRPARTHRVVDQRLQTQPRHHRARQQQPRISHQRPIIEHRPQPVDPTSYAPHRKCLLSWPERPSSLTVFSHVRRPFWWTRQPPQPHRTGGSRFRALDEHACRQNRCLFSGQGDGQRQGGVLGRPQRNNGRVTSSRCRRTRHDPLGDVQLDGLHNRVVGGVTPTK